MDKVDKVQQSIFELIEAGYDISFGKNRIYRSVSGEYMILKFTEDSNFIGEECFKKDQLEKAVAKFQKLSGDKA